MEVVNNHHKANSLKRIEVYPSVTFLEVTILPQVSLGYTQIIKGYVLSGGFRVGFFLSLPRTASLRHLTGLLWCVTLFLWL